MTPDQLNALRGEIIAERHAARRTLERLDHIHHLLQELTSQPNGDSRLAAGRVGPPAEQAQATNGECEGTAAAHGPQAANDSGIDARANGRGRTKVLDLLELAWGVIANAGEGDWARESKDWQDAAQKWRDKYHALLGLNKIEPLIAQELDVDLGPVAGWARHEPFATIATVKDADKVVEMWKKTEPKREPLRFSCSKPVTVGDQCEHVDVGMRSMSGLMEVVAIDREQKMLTTISDKGTVKAQLRVIPAKALQFVPTVTKRMFPFEVVDKTEPAATPTIKPPADKYLSGEDPQLNDEVNAPINRIASTAIVDGISWGSGLVMVRSIFAKHEYGYFEPQWVRIDECRLIERASHKPQPEPKREPTIADQKPLLDRYAEEEPPTEFHAAVAPIAEHMQQKLDEGRSAVERIEQAMAEAGIDPRPVLCKLSDGTEVRKGDRLWHTVREQWVTVGDRPAFSSNATGLTYIDGTGDLGCLRVDWLRKAKPEDAPTAEQGQGQGEASSTAAGPEASGKPLTPGEMDKIVEETLPKVKKWVRAKPLPTERPARRKSRNRDAAASKPVKTATTKASVTSNRPRSRAETRTKPAKTRAKQRKPAAKASKPGRNPGIR